MEVTCRVDGKKDGSKIIKEKAIENKMPKQSEEENRGLCDGSLATTFHRCTPRVIK